MKKLAYGLIGLLTISIVVTSCYKDNQKKQEDLTSSVLAVNAKYKTGNQNKKTNWVKAGFMGAGDVIGGMACTAGGPYCVLWGGFIASCGAATLYNDMMALCCGGQPPNGNNNGGYLPESSVRIGINHNLMLAKYTALNSEPVFNDNGEYSQFIMNEALQNSAIQGSQFEKESLMADFDRLNPVFVKMKAHADKAEIINLLKEKAVLSDMQKSILFPSIDFILVNEFNDTTICSYVNDMEDIVYNANSLSQVEKEKLYSAFEIMRYSYTFWYNNN